MAESELARLSGAARTCLTTLRIRAQESQRPDALIHDERAVELVERLRRADDLPAAIPLASIDRLMLALRCRDFDRCTREFLARHPDAAVVHIGCGLDTRCERVDNGSVQWVDLDLPEVVALRRRLLSARDERYQMLGSSVLESGWQDTVGALLPRPLLFLAEGVLMYFSEAQVRGLLFALAERFPGAELVFDGFSKSHVWLSNLSLAIARFDVRYGWGLRNGRELERWGGGLRLLEEWGLFDQPDPALTRVRWLRHVGLGFWVERMYRLQLGTAGS